MSNICAGTAAAPAKPSIRPRKSIAGSWSELVFDPRGSAKTRSWRKRLTVTSCDANACRTVDARSRWQFDSRGSKSPKSKHFTSDEALSANLQECLSCVISKWLIGFKKCAQIETLKTATWKCSCAWPWHSMHSVPRTSLLLSFIVLAPSIFGNCRLESAHTLAICKQCGLLSARLNTCTMARPWCLALHADDL